METKNIVVTEISAETTSAENALQTHIVTLRTTKDQVDALQKSYLKLTETSGNAISKVEVVSKTLEGDKGIFSGTADSATSATLKIKILHNSLEQLQNAINNINSKSPAEFKVASIQDVKQTTAEIKKEFKATNDQLLLDYKRRQIEERIAALDNTKAILANQNNLIKAAELERKSSINSLAKTISPTTNISELVASQNQIFKFYDAQIGSIKAASTFRIESINRENEATKQQKENLAYLSRLEQGNIQDALLGERQKREAAAKAHQERINALNNEIALRRQNARIIQELEAETARTNRLNFNQSIQRSNSQIDNTISNFDDNATGGRSAVLRRLQMEDAAVRQNHADTVSRINRYLTNSTLSLADAEYHLQNANRETTRQLLENHRAVQDVLNSNESLSTKVFKMIGLYRLWGLAIDTVKNALLSIPAAGIEMQNTISTLHASFSVDPKTLVPNKQLGEALTVDAMKMLRDEADRTGISLITLESNYRTFLASAHLAGESTATVNKIFKDLNTTITALHMTSDRAQLTFLALSQMFNKGKIQSEELVKQLGNLLPGAFAAFAKANDLSTQELIAQMKKGAVSAHETVAKFLEFYAKNYADAFTKASTGLNSELGRLESSWTNFSRALFAGTGGAMAQATKGMYGFLNAITPTGLAVQELSERLNSLFNIAVLGASLLAARLAIVNTPLLAMGASVTTIGYSLNKLLAYLEEFKGIKEAGSFSNYMEARLKDLSPDQLQLEAAKELNKAYEERAKILDKINLIKLNPTELGLSDKDKIQAIHELVNSLDGVENKINKLVQGSSIAAQNLEGLNAQKLLTGMDESYNREYDIIEKDLYAKRVAYEEKVAALQAAIKKQNDAYNSRPGVVKRTGAAPDYDENGKPTKNLITVSMEEQAVLKYGLELTDGIAKNEEKINHKLEEQLRLYESLKVRAQELYDQEQARNREIAIKSGDIQAPSLYEMSKRMEELNRLILEATNQSLELSKKDLNSKIESSKESSSITTQVSSDSTVFNTGSSNKIVAKNVRAIQSPENKELVGKVIGLANEYGIDIYTALALVAQESEFKINAGSGKGAKGLMQLMPATADRFNVKNVLDPDQNLRGGMAYLKWLSNRFKGNTDLMLAGYNAGEGAVDKYGKTIPPYRETQDYVKNIKLTSAELRKQSGGEITAAAEIKETKEISEVHKLAAESINKENDVRIKEIQSKHQYIEQLKQERSQLQGNIQDALNSSKTVQSAEEIIKKMFGVLKTDSALDAKSLLDINGFEVGIAILQEDMQNLLEKSIALKNEEQWMEARKKQLEAIIALKGTSDKSYLDELNYINDRLPEVTAKIDANSAAYKANKEAIKTATEEQDKYNKSKQDAIDSVIKELQRNARKEAGKSSKSLYLSETENSDAFRKFNITQENSPEIFNKIGKEWERTELVKMYAGIYTNFKDGFKTAFSEVLSGTKSFGESFTGLMDSYLKDIGTKSLDRLVDGFEQLFDTISSKSKITFEDIKGDLWKIGSSALQLAISYIPTLFGKKTQEVVKTPSYINQIAATGTGAFNQTSISGRVAGTNIINIEAERFNATLKSVSSLAITTATTMAEKVGMNIGAMAGEKMASLIPYINYAMVAIKAGFDIFKTASDETASLGTQIGTSMYAVRDAAGTIAMMNFWNPVGWVAAAVAAYANFTGSISNMIDGDFKRGFNNLILGPLGDLIPILTPRTPNTYINGFNSLGADYSPTKMDKYSAQAPGYKDLGDNTYFRGTNKGGFIGTNTTLGSIELSYHEIPRKTDMTALEAGFKQLLGVYALTNGAISSSLDSIDYANKSSTNTVKSFLTALGDGEEKNRIVFKQELSSLDTAEEAKFYYEQIRQRLSNTGTVAGKMWATIYKNISDSWVNLSATNSSFTFDAALIASSMADRFKSFSVLTIDNLTKKLKVTDKGGDAKAIEAELNARFSALFAIDKVLTDPAYNIKASSNKEDISSLIASWVDLGDNIPALADSFISLAFLVRKSVSVIDPKTFFNTLKVGQNNITSTFINKGYTAQQANSLSSSAITGATSLFNMGIRGEDLITGGMAFATKAGNAAKQTLVNATAAIDAAIAKGKEEKLLNESMSRETMVSILLATKAIDSKTVAEADFATQQQEATKVYLEGYDLVANTVASLRSTFYDFGLTVDTLPDIIDNITTSFGSLKAASQKAEEVMTTFFGKDFVAQQKVEIGTNTQKNILAKYDPALISSLGLKAGMGPEAIQEALKTAAGGNDKTIKTIATNILADIYSGINSDVNLFSDAANMIDPKFTAGAAYQFGDKISNPIDTKTTDNSKTFADKQLQVYREIAGLQLNSFAKQFKDVDDYIKDLENSVSDLNQGALEGLDVLKNLKYAEIFKPLKEELDNIGKSDAQIQVAKIESDFSDMIEYISGQTGASKSLTQQIIKDLTTIKNARLDQINKPIVQLVDSLVKASAKLRNTDFENTLTDIFDKAKEDFKTLKENPTTTLIQAQTAFDSTKDVIQNAYQKAADSLTNLMTNVKDSIQNARDSIADTSFNNNLDTQKSLLSYRVGLAANSPNFSTRAPASAIFDIGNKSIIRMQDAQDLKVYNRALSDFNKTIKGEAFDAKLNRQITAINKVQSLIQTRYEREIANINSLISASTSLGAKLKSLKTDENLSILAPKDQFSELLTNYQNTSALAKAGNTDALAKLPELIDSLLNRGKSFLGGAEYTNLFDYIMSDSSGLVLSDEEIQRKIQSASEETNTYLSNLDELLGALELQRQEFEKTENQKLVTAVTGLGMTFVQSLQQMLNELAPNNTVNLIQYAGLDSVPNNAIIAKSGNRTNNDSEIVTALQNIKDTLDKMLSKSDEQTGDIVISNVQTLQSTAKNIVESLNSIEKTITTNKPTIKVA